MKQRSVLPNALFNCDCLTLAERLPDESIDLVYVDPPWPQTTDFIIDDETNVQDVMDMYHKFMAARLQHFHRILKRTGTVFLHLRPGGITLIRAIIDQIFGQQYFWNQYILPRRIQFPRIPLPSCNYTIILFYSKSEDFTYKIPIRPYTLDEIKQQFPYEDEKGAYRLESLITLKKHGSRFGWKGITPEKGYSWRYGRERLNVLDQEGHISFDLSKKLPALKKYVDAGLPIGSIWDDLAKPLNSDEATGLIGQQHVELLSRIIEMVTEKGETIFDPFCGSGTTLIAAHQSGRKWIGCDISPEAYHLAIERLKNQLEIQPVSDFKSGDEKSVQSHFQRRYMLLPLEPWIMLWGDPDVSDTNVKPREETPSVNQFQAEASVKIAPLVITEGKTDWKHLKTALRRLKDAGYLPEDFEVEFKEYEDELRMGDDALLSMCRNNSILPQARKTIFVFDCDKPQTVKEVMAGISPFKDWGNNVYSFSIPVPDHRKETPEISIEFYYPDEDLQRKDAQGRRLFLSTEFHSRSGRHLVDTLNCQDINKLKGGIKIVDDMVFDQNNQNVALSKNDFAENVLNGNENFDDLDVFEFTKIFGIIQQIMDDSNPL